MTGSPSVTLTAVPRDVAPWGKPHLGRTYGCDECGHVLRVSGLGRHRVFFEPGDERSEDPIMNRVCSACGHGLPGKNPR